MKTTYAAENYEITPEVTAYTEEKVQGLERFVHDENAEIRIVYYREPKHQTGEVFRVDMTVHVGAHRTHAVGHGMTMIEALDKAKDELKFRLTREKGRFIKMARAVQSRVKDALRFTKE